MSRVDNHRPRLAATVSDRVLTRPRMTLDPPGLRFRHERIDQITIGVAFQSLAVDGGNNSSHVRLRQQGLQNDLCVPASGLRSDALPLAALRLDDGLDKAAKPPFPSNSSSLHDL